MKIPKPPFGAAQINRHFTHGENLILHMKFISQLNCEDERQMALNLELKGMWNWPLKFIHTTTCYFVNMIVEYTKQL